MSDKNRPVQPRRRTRFAAWFMRTFFRLLYHPMAWAYDLVAATASIGRWQRWVKAAASLVDGANVLELGFGPGHLQTHLTETGINVTGIDESFQMARQAFRRMARSSYSPRLVRGLAQNLPYPSDYFDHIVATFPTPYIVDPATLAEIRRVLRPGGQLVVLVAGWITGKSLPDRFMDFIFRFTGQAPKPEAALTSYTQPYSEAGFQTSLRFIELTDSRLMFILARR